MASVSPYDPEPLAMLSTHAKLIYAALTECMTRLDHIAEALHTGELRNAIEQGITVNNQPQALSRNGRRHNMVWVTQTVSCLIDNAMGNFAAVMLYAGWNPLDLTEGARIMTATTSPTTFNLIWRCTDFELPGGLV